MAMLERLGGDAYVQRIAEEQARQAIAAVDTLDIPEESKQLLRAVAGALRHAGQVRHSLDDRALLLHLRFGLNM